MACEDRHHAVTNCFITRTQQPTVADVDNHNKRPIEAYLAQSFFCSFLVVVLDIRLQATKTMTTATLLYRRRPRRPPFRRVESDGIGVTSSMRPIFIDERARARSADWAPGPGVLVLLPPVARSLMCRAVMPKDLHFSATSYNDAKKEFSIKTLVSLHAS